jgi:pyruvate carboxylase
MYTPFEAGTRSGTARVYDHEIPGGQYSNLYVQCKSMGLWDRWEEVLDMYRDVNALLGDVIKVTPSSKSVGDFALYLINKNMRASDVLTMADSIDFPQSVFELAEGRLGFPHRGFPPEVQAAILKGAPPLPTGERSSAALDPADFEGERERLAAEHGRPFADEEVNSSLLYPAVFAEYLAHVASHGEAVTHLPTPAFWYGLGVGETAHMT